MPWNRAKSYQKDKASPAEVLSTGRKNSGVSNIEGVGNGWGVQQNLEVNSKPPRSHRNKFMGYKRLQDLNEKSPTEIVTTLVNPFNGFHDLISSPLKKDILVLIMNVLSKAMKCEFDGNTRELLSVVCQNSSKLLESIQHYLTAMPSDADQNIKLIAGQFIRNLLNFYEVVIKKLPNTASEKLKNIFITTDMAIVGLEKYQGIELKKEKDAFDQLFRNLNNMIEERDKRTQKMDSRKECLQYIRPPDNFRDKSVYPTSEDLLGERNPFVRPNIIEGSYRDAEEYLDIQFRLLREDFVAPLREGIANYISSDKRKHVRIDNVRIYRNVFFGDQKIIQDNVGVTLCFDPDKKMKIKWEVSKRFMYGSLLIITDNHFTSFILGTVIERDIRSLEKGEVIISIENNDANVNFHGRSFVMLESEVYFEPYKHVMIALQTLNENNFPMKNYILSIENNPSPPEYLRLNPESKYKVNGLSIQVLNAISWPSETELQLDISQRAAFKAALTEEFVVIQGPPGTGKTFLGLKIAKCLLGNAEIWNSEHCPILVVCYTNHALDQFLEGLVPVTDNLVRLGGQSSSQMLQKFNIKELRKFQHHDGRLWSLKKDYFTRMRELLTNMKEIEKNLEELRGIRGILSVKELAKYNIVPATFLSSLADKGDDMLGHWLWLEEEALYANVSVPDREAPRDNADDKEEVFVFQMGPRSRETLYLDHDDITLSNVSCTLEFAVDLHIIENEKMELTNAIKKFQEVDNYNRKNVQDLHRLEDRYRFLSFSTNYWIRNLKINFRTPIEKIKRLENTHNSWQLSHPERWILYKHWVEELKAVLRRKYNKRAREYRDVAKLHKEVMEMFDLKIMQSALVVGMTTSNAARLHSSLQTLKPKIVIVEEAAEVLEAHVVISIARESQHVILIGDHQQLRPAPAVYRLAREFHLDVSLFERMIKNGLTCYSLENQHRMRPEISSLITPTIYPNLKNDVSVNSFPDVRGITKSLFFVSHNVFEEEVEDISSRRNRHEADFLLALCRYLLLQGYSSADITILVTYKGQLFYMKMEQRKNDLLKDVKMAVVDNFQGEENKIILLSLVRSNEESKIGFLKNENRVCVALSRAKEGLFISGNMDVLVAGSDIWPKVKATLEQQNALGLSLTLRCQVHCEQLTTVSCAEDFNKVPEGGCLLLCGAVMPCGHPCESICHVNNREHKEFKCHRRCERIPEDCSLDHSCPKLCWESCGRCMTTVQRSLPCGHEQVLPCHIDYQSYKCAELVETVLPLCEHVVQKPCNEDVATFPCSHPCPNRLPCGHSCMWNCHANRDPDHIEYQCKKKCTRKSVGCTQEHICAKMCYEECGLCVVEVTMELPACKHKTIMKCSGDPSSFVCKKNCSRAMECGHWCRKKCFEKCGDCQEKVVKVIPGCGHELPGICCEPPNPKRCRKPCERKLPCGHPCNKSCGQMCTSKCLVKVKCQKTIPCGHSIEIPCYLQNGHVEASSPETIEEVLALCEMPCGQQLKCGHRCKGSCGECLQGRVHVPCKEKCGRSLICGHKCRMACASSCPPCNAQCLYRCTHSRCNRKCGVPCVPCQEACKRRCPHGRCSRLCGELCDVAPCQEPCPKRLRCHHPCVGFCGDRCPPLCRICDQKQLTEIFFGREDEPDSRFVYLVDCKHTLEAEGLERWLQESDNEITLKTCPKCKSYIQCTERYINYVKKTFEDVAKVKKEIYGDFKDLEVEKNNLLEKCREIRRIVSDNIKLCHNDKFTRLLRLCMDELRPTHWKTRQRFRNYVSKSDLLQLKSEIEIINDLVSTVLNCKSENFLSDIKAKLFHKFDFILNVVMNHHKKISPQITSDFNRECERFFCMAQLCAVESSNTFQNLLKTNNDFKVMYEATAKIINSSQVYSDSDDVKVKTALKSLKKSVVCIDLTEKERREIVQAVGVKQGAWFKCPNGHIYCIGDCGGAMVQATCPECQEAIGGTNHRLLQTNTLAREMDEAIRPAYPQGVNDLYYI